MMIHFDTSAKRTSFLKKIQFLMCIERRLLLHLHKQRNNYIKKNSFTLFLRTLRGNGFYVFSIFNDNDLYKLKIILRFYLLYSYIKKHTLNLIHVLTVPIYIVKKSFHIKNVRKLFD